VRRLALTGLLVLAATAAWAYVPAAEKLAATWAQTYDKAPAVMLSGVVESGAAAQPFRAWASPKGAVFELAGRPVSDPAATLALGLVLTPGKTYPQLLAAGLDADKTGLARVAGRIAYTLGSLGEKQPGTQVWLDRQTYAPAVVLLARAGKPAGRIDYRGYAESGPGRLVPSEIRADVDGAQRVFQIDKLTPVKK
jgi:hypothetical protein